MSELKTLKDLCYNLRVEHQDGTVEDEPCDGVVRESEVKAEAVKWVKTRIAHCIFSCRNNHLRCNEHKFWMERFNITEEDLETGEKDE